MSKSLFLIVLSACTTNAFAYPKWVQFSRNAQVIGVRSVDHIPTPGDMSIVKTFRLTSGNTLQLSCTGHKYLNELRINDADNKPIPLQMLNYDECLNIMGLFESASERKPITVLIQNSKISINESL